MSQSIVEIEGVASAIQKLDAFGLDLFDTLLPPFKRASARMEAEIKFYPPRLAPGVWARETSPKQKAAYFAKLKKEGAGKSDHYVRTGLIGRRWTQRVIMGGGTMTFRIGNNTPYVRFVQDDEKQARFHRGRWIVPGEVLFASKGDIIDDVKATIIAKANSLGL